MRKEYPKTRSIVNNKQEEEQPISPAPATAHRQVTTTEAANLLDVPADLIAKWKHRGKVTPVGMLAGQGRGGTVPLYRLEELRPLAERYHATRRRDGDG